MTDIIEAGVLDSSHATDSIILTGWVLDRSIDPDKVERAWNVLVEAWPILVARLRRDVKTSHWQYHIPEPVSSTGSFSTSSISGPIHNHYKYAKPSSTIRCTRKENPHHLFTPNAPSSVKELLKRDIPQTQLHVTLFDDAALVGLSVPHILCDGYGVTEIMRALSTILSSGSPPLPLDHADPYAAFAVNESRVPPPPYWRALNALEKLVIYARALWEWLTDRKVENREVFFPRDEVARIKAQAMDDIREEQGQDTKLWVSTSDAILAFCLKCTHLDAGSNAPLNVFYTANMRQLLTLPSPFLHNSVCMVITPTLPVSAISSMSLGALALHIRQTLEEQTTMPALDKWIRWRLQNAFRKKIFFEPWNGQWDVVTNWRDMKLMNIDFSGASPGDAGAFDVDIGPPKKHLCRYMWGNGIQPISLRNWIGLWADDPSGGVWMSGFFPKRIWEDKRGYGAFSE